MITKNRIFQGNPEPATYLVAAVLVFLLVGFNHRPSIARSQANQRHQIIYNQIRKAHEDVEKADQKLVSTMRLVRKRLRDQVGANKSYSLLGADSNSKAYRKLVLSLNENLPANPYESILPETEDQVGDDQSPRVRLILDPSISHSQVDVLRYHPRKDWRDSPGNISIVHNGYDFLLIWAASYDGKPIREKKTTKIITLRLRF